MIVVAVAVIVVAFSLGNQQSALTSTIVPDAFNGAGAYGTIGALAAQYPDRRPGSAGDGRLADHVAQTFRGEGLAVQTSTFTAQTIDGPRTLETVTGTLAGQSGGSIVIVAHRDSLGKPSAADLSGTAVLLGLAQVLSSQTQQRSIVLASTSGSVGAAGAEELARTLPGPVDAVIVLGDMGGPSVRYPIVVPWSDSTLVAPTVLRNTVAAALQQQVGLAAGQESLGGQFLHLAFPLAASEQRPFADFGEPAVLLSTSSARPPSPGEQPNQAQVTGFGRAVLQSVSALEAGPEVPASSSFLRWQGKVIPAWAIRLIVLALILPVLAATVDGLARARRRGHSVARWVAWVLSACLPFALAVLAVRGLWLVGLINAAPPGPVNGDALTLHGPAIAILAGLGCLIALGFAVRWRVGRNLRGQRSVPTPTPTPTPGNGHERHRARKRAVEDAASPGAAAALLLVLCAVTLVIWLENPFAAALIVPALHLWMWTIAPERRLRAPWAVLLLAAGLAPGVLAAMYYAATLGLGPAGAAWNAVLMLAGGEVGVIAALEWSVVLGCAVSLALMIVRIARQPKPADAPVTVRGPITYAGPGSLGGTASGGSAPSGRRSAVNQ